MKRLFLNLDSEPESELEQNSIKMMNAYFSPIQHHKNNNINMMNVPELIDQFLQNPVRNIAKDITSNMIQKQEIFENILNTYKLIATNDIKNFDINEPNNPKYKTYVYANQQQIAKIINYQCGSLAEYMIIKELAFQQYASELTRICDFETPLILDYGIAKASPKKYRFDCIIFIIMDKMLYDNLLHAVDKIDLNDERKCNNVANKLNEVNKCLEDNGLYHNDYHSNNVMLNVNSDGTFKVGLIDYGEASNDYTSFKDWEYTCNKLRDIKRNKTPTSVVFGGKRRSNKRRSNKRRSNKRRSKRTYKKKRRT